MHFNLKSRTLCQRIPTEEDAFQDYSVKGTLGSGAFGTIFKARHNESGMKVAIKVIQDVFQSEVLVRSVVREVSILRQLTKMYFTRGSFQHTVLLHDFILFKTADGKIGAGLCLDYHRHDLADNIQERIPKTSEQLTKLLYSILCSLKFVHSAGIMHRDIKPDNYLVGRHGHLYLCDFGLARNIVVDDLHIYTDDSEKHDIIVELGLTKRERKKRARGLSPRVCSRSYRPPEVILLNRRYDEKVDLWSAGCTMLKILNSENRNLLEKELSPFGGATCFPLSPGLEGDSSQENSDVLDKIVNFQGMPSELDCAFLTHESQMEHLQRHETESSGQQLTRMYPDYDSELLEIIDSILEFNPYFRPTATRLLQSEVFNSVRREKMEAKAPFKVLLDMDEPQEFNYEKKTSNLKSTSNYLEILLEEQSLVIQQQVDHLNQH